jgi:hypothetical protein
MLEKRRRSASLGNYGAAAQWLPQPCLYLFSPPFSASNTEAEKRQTGSINERGSTRRGEKDRKEKKTEEGRS